MSCRQEEATVRSVYEVNVTQVTICVLVSVGVLLLGTGDSSVT